MATYTYNYTVFYDDMTNALVTHNAATFTLDDDGGGANGVGNSNDIFEPGETVFSGFGTYLGTVTIGGVKGPAFQLTGQIGIYLPSAPTGPVEVTLPAITVENFTFCFAEGTQIATVRGELRVEDLQIGDLLETADGSATAVRWIGRQTVLTMFGPADRLHLVRIAAGALGNDLPHSDLTVTADHAMLVDGVLCNASALVNDVTITRVPLAEMGDSYTVYHVETEAHEIIYANGAAAETYIDHASRRVFDNFAEYEALYGEEPEMQELLYPRITTARQLPFSVVDGTAPLEEVG